MLAYGGGSIKRTGLYDQLCTLLQQAGKRIIDFGGITSNPTYEKVLEGAQIVNQEQVDFILAVGGGSVVDGVKIIAAAAKAPKDLWEMEFEDHQFPTEGVPFGIVLTLSGTCLLYTSTQPRGVFFNVVQLGDLTGAVAQQVSHLLSLIHI